MPTTVWGRVAVGLLVVLPALAAWWPEPFVATVTTYRPLMAGRASAANDAFAATLYNRTGDVVWRPATGDVLAAALPG